MDGVTVGPWEVVATALNGVTGKYEVMIDPPDGGPSGGRINWYWEATDTSLEAADAPTG